MCSVPDCGQPRRKFDWCATHYSQWHDTGEAKPFAYKWSRERICVVCGADVPEGTGRRKHCSSACAALDSNHHGTRPTIARCAQCGDEIDLLAVGKAGKRRRTDVRMCQACKRDAGKYGMSVGALVSRDGVSCSICGDDVDLSLTAPDPFRASIDHVTPRSRGGTNDPSNLALCHLWCNQVKSDREGFTLRN